MGILNFWKGGKAKPPEIRASERSWLGTRYAEEYLSPEDALRVGTVYACVRVISETVATLPCILYRRLPDGGKERAVDHPLYSVLHDAPNLFQDATQFFEMMTGHVVLRGNAYAMIGFSGGTTTLTPLNPSKVRVKTAQGGAYKFYEYNDSGSILTIRPEAMLHIYGLSSDGLVGLSPIELAMRTVSLAKKQEVYADRMFTNQASPGGVLRHPGKLSKEAAERLKVDFERKYSGAEKSGSTMLLEEGMEWQTVGLTNEQAQFLEGRKFSRNDIAAWFRIPPHKIGDLEHATFSNIEHQALEFVTDTIRPWLVRWERALMRALFTEAERKEYTIEFLVDAIVRGDIQTRYNAYAIARQWGWLNVDEIRAKENLNPLPDGQGKIYLSPLNMTVIGEDEPADQEESEEEDQPTDSTDGGMANDE
jgi:HK97 family phage portal protein